MRRVAPTPVQKVMIALMAIAYSSLAIWLIPELRGIVAGGEEDTYSEWVWDLPTGVVLGIAAFHLLAGILFVWSAGHFVEGMLARR